MLFKNQFMKYIMEQNRKKIIVRLYGGLGNNLFQIASGHIIAKKQGKELYILYDKSKNIHSRNDYTKTVFRKCKSIDCIDKELIYIIIEPRSYHNYFEFPNIDISIFIDSYLQSEKYFEDYKNDIYELFEPEKNRSELLHNKYPNISSSYFIHIRRGDYLTHNYFNLDNYYIKAINYILEKNRDTHFYIFSDDIEYCKNYSIFTDINKTFIENEDEINSLYLMSMCKQGGICSNSTYSWWGSYLNDNPNKLVINPDKWLANNLDVNLCQGGAVILSI